MIYSKTLQILILSMFWVSCEQGEEGFALFEEVAVTRSADNRDGGIEFESWFREDELIQLANSEDVTIGVKLTSSAGPNVRYKYLMNEVVQPLPS